MTQVKQVHRNVAAGSLASIPVLALCRMGSNRRGAMARAMRHGRSGALLTSAGLAWWVVSDGATDKDVVQVTGTLAVCGAAVGFAGGAIASLVFDAVR